MCTTVRPDLCLALSKLSQHLCNPTPTQAKHLYHLLQYLAATTDKRLEIEPTVLRAVLTHSPNSCLPERVFSILNGSFDDDQERALADYMELSLMVQYNERDPRR